MTDRFGNVSRLARALTTLVPLNFLFFLYLAAVAYVNSSFLGRFLSPTWVSLSFAAQAALTIAVLWVLPPIVAKAGVRTVILLLVPITAAAALFLGFSGSAAEAVPFFLIQGVGIYCLMYLLDLYLESATKDESVTGNVRGIFLTSGNLAVFLAPFAITILIIGEAYSPLYVFGAAVLIPAFILAATTLKRLTPSTPRGHSFKAAWDNLWCCNPSLLRAMGAYLLLWTFYSWVVIYAPLVLIDSGGYSWQVVGLVTAFALLPFLLLEIPLGVVADRWLGEKEIMAGGFAILGLSTVFLSVVPLTLIIPWALVFFATRVGAAMVEISTETYFFKQVNENDAALVSLFRMTRSFGFLVGPVIALVLLPFTGLPYLFGAFGLILFAGIPLALGIWDTK
ncbi:MAG: MFS transporter [Patescibacteria group bacterium]